MSTVLVPRPTLTRKECTMEAEVRDFSRLSRSGTVIMNGHVWPFSLPSNSRLREPKVGDRIHVVEAVEGEDGNEIVEWRYHS